MNSNILWKDNKTLPENRRKIIIITDIGVKLSGIFNIRTPEEGAIVDLPDYEFCWWKNIDKWVYLTDLLSQSTRVEKLEKENAALQKALLLHIKDPLKQPAFISKEQYEHSLDKVLEQLKKSATKGDNDE